MKTHVLGVLALIAGLLGSVMPAWSAEPHWPESLVIGTASPGGTYYSYGEGMARILTRELGIRVSMRLWEDEPPGEAAPATARDYETVGFVVKGRAELHIEWQKILINPGDSWLVPRGSSHTYKILESFTAVEATSPPAQVHGRDES